MIKKWMFIHSELFFHYPNINIIDVGNGKTAEIPDEINLINMCWETDPKDRPSFEDIIRIIKSNDFNLINEMNKKLPQIMEFLISFESNKIFFFYLKFYSLMN